MKKNSLFVLITTITLLFLSCRNAKIPDGNTWKGVFQTSTKGDQKAEVFFDFKKHEGMIMLPDLIPIPLNLKDVTQNKDSVFFTIGFRSGPAWCRGLLANDTLKGIMTKEGVADSYFWLATSVESANIYNQPKPAKDEPVVIETFSGSESENSIKTRLTTILEKYDLEPYIYTKRIMIRDNTIPHSHPVLTLSTRDTTEELILSTFIHEQMHWYSLSRNDTFETLMEEIKAMYPTVPVQLPEGGGSEDGTYLHIAINYLEYKNLKQVLGDEEALKVLEHLKTHHYTWIYKTMENDYEKLEQLFDKHHLHIPM